MIEIRLHGRGGQGTVTAAELIAVAAFYDGKFSQAFPSFGVERRGAPVEAYCRLDDKFIRLREQIYHPDFIIIQDVTLLGIVDVFRGYKKNTIVTVNTEQKSCEPKGLPKGLKIQTIPATRIALDAIGHPIINTVMLGAFAGMSQLISLSSIEKAIKERFDGKLAEKNLKAVKYAYDHCCANIDLCYENDPSTKLSRIDDKQKFGANT